MQVWEKLHYVELKLRWHLLLNQNLIGIISGWLSIELDMIMLLYLELLELFVLCGILL